MGREHFSYINAWGPPFANRCSAVPITYTLEYDDFGNKVTWHFCRKYQGGHDNFGEVDECVTMEEFVNLIAGRILKISKPGDQKSWLARILDFFKR